MWCFSLCQRANSSGKLKMYTIDGSKYSAMTTCNPMITGTRRQKHTSSGANRASDIAVMVNNKAECNLKAVNPIIKCFSGQLIPKCWHSLESTTVYTAPPSFDESLTGPSNVRLPHLPLHIHTEEMIGIFLMSNIHIRLCLPKLFTLARL